MLGGFRTRARAMLGRARTRARAMLGRARTRARAMLGRARTRFVKKKSSPNCCPIEHQLSLLFLQHTFAHNTMLVIMLSVI